MKWQRALLTLVMALAVFAVNMSATLAAGIDWSNHTLRAEGAGVAPPNVYNAAQARMLARRAAIADAYRQLAEQVRGVQVDSSTTVENMMVTSDIIRTQVSAVIQGARIVDEYSLDNNGYSVTLEVPLFGVNSIAGAVLERPSVRERYIEPDRIYVPERRDRPIRDNTGTSAAPAPRGKAIGDYTGLIVDCRGLGLKPAMSPVIKNEGGESIYGYKNLDYDEVIENGMAGYAYTMKEAKRAGSNPLIVRAIALDGSANPVLAAEDARRVLIENGATGFLDKTRVVFLR